MATRTKEVTLLVLIAALPVAGLSRNFKALTTSEQGIDVVHLSDEQRGIDVVIVPSIGNRAVEMKVHGKNILFFPYPDLTAFRNKPGLNGVPLLAPWANRLGGASYWANGRKYLLNAGLGNYQTENHGLPIHGLLTTSPLWRVTDLGADKQSAHVTSRLQFWKYPELMAQWPFAQEYEMTYRLAEGSLEVKTTVLNVGSEAIPIVIGFHPYYRIPDKPRSEWTAALPVRKSVVTDSRLVPTGELKPSDLPDPLPLKDRILDDGFTDLNRDTAGKAHFFLRSGPEQIEVMFGPKYPVAVIWEPPAPEGPAGEFICFEPMTAVTNGINLNHDGKYPDLQMLPPGATWTESFWIRPIGF